MGTYAPRSLRASPWCNGPDTGAAVSTEGSPAGTLAPISPAGRLGIGWWGVGLLSHALQRFGFGEVG